MSILREELITNHLLLDYFDMWDEFDITKVEDPKTIRYFELLENHIKNQIDASIKWLESDEAREYFFGETEYQREVFSALEDEWDEILSAKYPSVDALLDEVYRRGKAKGYTDMRERIRYTEADKLALSIARNYNYHLIRKIDNDTRSQIKNKITEAVIAGEHPYTVAPKILNVAEEKLQGTNFTPKQRATMIARTEISRVQNTGILQSYINEGYTEVKILTAGDSRVCNLCLRYAFEYEEDAEITYDNHGEERTHNILKLIKGGEFPPFHPLCRCTYLSVWHSKGEPPENPFIINLTPQNYLYEKIIYRYMDEGIITTLKGFDDSKWTEDGIKKSLEGFIEGTKLGMVSKGIFDFIQDASVEFNEGLTTYSADFNPISRFIPGDSERYIDVPLDDINAVNGSYFGLVGHSHTQSRIPLPDWRDIETGILNLDIEHNFIYAPGFGVVVIKNNNLGSEFNINKSEFKKDYDKAHKNRNKYVNENILKVKNEYKSDPENRYISDFRKKQDLLDIEDRVRHSNLDVQLEFYNEKLKSYGIELLYISPQSLY